MADHENRNRQMDVQIINTSDLINMFKDLEQLKHSDFAFAWHSFPTTREGFQSTLKDIGVDGLDRSAFAANNYDAVISELNDALPRFADIDELNYLAVKMADLSEDEHEVFRSVLETGRHQDSIKDIINITENLDLFYLQPTFSAENYGEFLSTMKSDEFGGTIEKLAKSNDPDMRELAEYITHLEKYFDTEAYGRDAVKAENGVFTEQGYLTESEGFREVYHDPQDIPAEHRLTDPAEQLERKPSLLGQLAAAKEQAAVAPKPEALEKKTPSGRSL